MDETKSKPTVCCKCANFRNLEPNSVRSDVWYNHVCLAHKESRELNYTTGKMEYSYGDKYAKCRDINVDGNCSEYEPKRTAADVIMQEISDLQDITSSGISNLRKVVSEWLRR